MTDYWPFVLVLIVAGGCGIGFGVAAFEMDEVRKLVTDLRAELLAHDAHSQARQMANTNALVANTNYLVQHDKRSADLHTQTQVGIARTTVHLNPNGPVS